MFYSEGLFIGINGGGERTTEDCCNGEREADSEVNVAENMTVLRKADRQSSINNSYATCLCGNAFQRPHFSLYQSQQSERCRRKAALNHKKPSIHHEPTGNEKNHNLSYLWNSEFVCIL